MATTVGECMMKRSLAKESGEQSATMAVCRLCSVMSPPSTSLTPPSTPSAKSDLTSRQSVYEELRGRGSTYDFTLVTCYVFFAELEEEGEVTTAANKKRAVK